MESNIDLSKITLKNIYAVNVIMRKGKQVYIRKNRTNYAFSLKLEGETIYTSKSKRYFSNLENLIMISKNSEYTYTSTKPGECIMIEFDADYEAQEFDILAFKLSKKSQQELSKLFTYISSVWKTKNNNYLLKCKSIFYEILAEIKIEDEQSYTYNNFKKIIKPSIDYMNFHYEDADISLESLAQLSNISTIYFRKIFFKIYNTSPIKHLIKIRINKAKEFLRGDYISISDIANLTGFSSVYTFSKAFKKETGLSPTEYRKIKLSKFDNEFRKADQQ